MDEVNKSKSSSLMLLGGLMILVIAVVVVFATYLVKNSFNDTNNPNNTHVTASETFNTEEAVSRDEKLTFLKPSGWKKLETSNTNGELVQLPVPFRVTQQDHASTCNFLPRLLRITQSTSILRSRS